MGNASVAGFLDLSIDEGSTVVTSITLSLFLLALMIQCIISLTAWSKIRKHPGIGTAINICFAVSVAFALLYTVNGIVRTVWMMSNRDLDTKHAYDISLFISVMTFSLFFASILITFIVRLYVTFKASTYRMYNRLIITFVVIMALYFLISIPSCFLYAFTDFINTALLLALCNFILYVLGCILAVFFFVSNLSKLAKSRKRSKEETAGGVMQLDQRQQRLSNLSSKYILLFTVAMVSTMLLWGLSFLVSRGLRANFHAVDDCVNLWCIYLQFCFAKGHYAKWCGCCDKMCRRCWSRRIRRIIRKHPSVPLNVTIITGESTSKSNSKPMDTEESANTTGI